MTTPPSVAMSCQDVYDPRPVRVEEKLVSGPKWDHVRAEVDLGSSGGVVVRDYLVHPGAVSVIVLNPAHEVLLQRQYRHPVGHQLWEIPAGLLDVPGEPAHTAAARELAEEADLVAREWGVLADYFNSPGCSDEAVRVFLARGLSPVPQAQRHNRCAEEADLAHQWVPVEHAVDLVLTGKIQNPSAVIGILATWRGLQNDWAQLRPADCAWPGHKHYRS